jgi:transcription initiation factor IIE alpha subunit
MGSTTSRGLTTDWPRRYDARMDDAATEIERHLRVRGEATEAEMREALKLREGAVQNGLRNLAREQRVTSFTSRRPERCWRLR